MRIATKTLQMQWLADIYRRQEKLAQIQKQVTSGYRISTAGDDPAGAARVVALDQGLDRLQNFAANGEAARRRLSMEEIALDKFGDSLGRVRELAVQAGGGAQSSESRRAIAAEMRELLSGLVETANSQDGEGHYIFAGNDVQGRPINFTAGVANYAGDDGVRHQRVSDTRTIRESDAGSEVFFAIRNGNGHFAVAPAAGNLGTAFFQTTAVTAGSWIPDTYTVSFSTPTSYTVTNSAAVTVASGAWAAGDSIAFAGASVSFSGQPVAGDSFTIAPSANRDIFATVNDMIATLEASEATPVGRARFQNAFNSAFMGLDQAESHLSDIRSTVGARLAALEEQKSHNEELAVQLQTTLSTVRDVDYPHAISSLETELTALEAAHKVFAQTRASSLFDLL